MRQTRILMGMPVTVEIVDPHASAAAIDAVFALFTSIDATFSTYKDDSAISRINRGELTLAQAGAEVREIMALAEQTRRETHGYFDIMRDGRCDPSGIVKGWAIQRAATLLAQRGYQSYSVEAGGDLQVAGQSARGDAWRVGIRNPFNLHEIVKVLAISDGGVATSGTSIRGDHIYDPHQPGPLATEIVSLTVVGPTIYEADRFATAAFAMGRAGIAFIADRDGLEGYQIDRHGVATLTPGFARYVIP